MGSLLNIGLTGLNAAQAHLLVTSNNIANANVAGYHRQRAIQSNQVPQYTGNGFMGQGTQIDTIMRAYSQHLENQVLSSSAQLERTTSYLDQVSQINNMLGDSTSGLSPSIEQFFAGMQEVAANPTSIAARQSLISNAEAMVSRFESMYNRLSEIRQGTETDIKSTIDQINMLSGAIADMNQRIIEAQGGSIHQPNDLMDQRDALIAELNKLVEVQTVPSSTPGAMDVTFGNGQPLVTGNQATRLAAVRDPMDPSRSTIAMLDSKGNPHILPESLISGGKLGGLLEFRKGTLDRAQNELGLIALGITEKMNEQHQLGVDLDGILGGNFFKPMSPALMPALAGVSAEVTDVSALAADDYILMNNGGVFTMKTSGGQQIPLTSTVSGANTIFSGGGLEITVPTASLGQITPQGMMIQPTRYASRDMEVAITDPRKVAAGDPVSGKMGGMPTTVDKVLSDYMTDIKTTGKGGIDSNSDGRADFADITIKFDPATKSMYLDPAVPGAQLQRYDPDTDNWVNGSGYDPAVDGGGVRLRIQTNPADPEALTIEFTVKGDWKNNGPLEHDAVTLTPSEAGVADNRNAVAMGALQTTKLLYAGADGKGTATFQSAYASTVSAVGTKTRELQIEQKSQQALLNQAELQRDSVSAVNMDEEAANLIRFQQAYQASSRVMNVAQTLFNEIISLGR